MREQSAALDTIIPNTKKALFFAKRQLAELVYDAVNLEGIHYTLPEVQTLLEGVTVGGHHIVDQQIALNQAQAWRFLFEAVQEGSFHLSQNFVCQLHRIAGENEALSWGVFRAGQVTISGTEYLPPPADQLIDHWKSIVLDYRGLSGMKLYQAAIGFFLDMARIQFFYDVNKRMGRFMMNGILLVQGYPVINLPAKRQLEFNTLMLEFYRSHHKTPMTDFMLDCIDARVVDAMSEV